MSPQEFLELNKAFEEAMEKRATKEGLLFKILGKLNHMIGPYTTYYILGDEVYYVYNNGNRATWGYEGKAQF